jgi:hypothetical protein
MQQQMDGPAATALEQGGGDALLRPGEITATGSNDDDGAMNQNRGGNKAAGGNAAAWATAAEDKLMGYRANERGKLSGDFVAAGDGLVAFGAIFILPVQPHY